MCGGAAADIERVRPLARRHGQGGVPSRPARRRPRDEVPQQPDHRDQLRRASPKAWRSASATGSIRRRWSTCSTSRPAMSWISQTHIRQRVLSRSFDDPFKLALMLKDIGIATAARAQRRRAGAALGAEPGALARRRRRRRARRERQRARALDRAARPHRDHARRDAARAERLAMRVLVTGADGFIGRALVHALRVGHDVVATDRDDGDIADPAHLDRLFARARSIASSTSPRSSAAPPRPTSRPAGASTSTRRSACSIAAARRRATAARSPASSTPARSRSSARRCRRASTTRTAPKPSSATARTSASPSC